MLSFSCSTRLVLRVVLPLLLTACGTTDPGTDFTMAARVNGGSWAPGGEGAIPPAATAKLYEGDHTLVLFGTQVGVSPRTRDIGIEVRNVVGSGSYPLGAASDGQGSAVYGESTGLIGSGNYNPTFYSTSATRTGTVVVTALDMTRQTISGTFSFDAATPQGGLVAITAGVFDGHFASLPGSAY